MNNDAFKNLWKVFSKLALLSHGQASVERGFSINRQIEVENLKEDSYIGQRLIHDFLQQIGRNNISRLKITDDLRKHATNAHQRYQDYQRLPNGARLAASSHSCHQSTEGRRAQKEVQIKNNFAEFWFTKEWEEIVESIFY